MTNELIDSLITSLEDVRHDVWVEEQGEENEGDSLAVLDRVIDTLKKQKTPSTTDLPHIRIKWLEMMLEESLKHEEHENYAISGEYFWSSLHILLSKYKELEKKNIPLPPPPSEAKESFDNYIEVFFADESKIIGIIMEQAKITGVSARIIAIHSNGLLRRRVWYSVKGTPDALARFVLAMRHALERWWSK